MGIALTTAGSWKAKKVIAYEESNKHQFLSWMQAELLPAMNTDAASAMQTMVENLSSFNATFANNTKELNNSLSLVAEATKGQAEILNGINSLKINRIATANIEVYDKLKKCTTEIGHLAEFLQMTQEYLANVRALNGKLDDLDNRYRMIEDMAIFFKQERANVEKISGIIAYSMGEADTAFNKSISILKESITTQNDTLIQHMVEQNQRLIRVMDEQQSTLESKGREIDKLMTELSQLGDVKRAISNLEKATTEQNKKIGSLVQSISELARIKTTGEVMTPLSVFSRMPKWVIISIASVIGVSFIWLNVWMILCFINL